MIYQKKKTIYIYIHNIYITVVTYPWFFIVVEGLSKGGLKTVCKRGKEREKGKKK